MAIYYIDRITGRTEEEIVAGDKFLKWIYETSSGQLLLEAFIKKKAFSYIYGKFQDLSISKNKIKSFIDDLKIDMTEAKVENINSYKTFNQFFIRELKKVSRPVIKERNILVSPADGRIFAYQEIEADRMLQIKGNSYSLKDLFQDQELARDYQGGTCFVIRLCPSDYHRFHFPDSGIPGKTKKIKGKYYSVNPIALKKIKNLYPQNKRELTIFQSDNFDDIAIVEVGATCVGSIIQTYMPGEHLGKGLEKGYFKFGGSTVILLVKKMVLEIDQDLIDNTKRGIETKVCFGERIGKHFRTFEN
ncbi:MAG: phosphatidylserine decarboxylase [Eubacteriales bacterium]